MAFSLHVLVSEGTNDVSELLVKKVNVEDII